MLEYALKRKRRKKETSSRPPWISNLTAFYTHTHVGFTSGVLTFSLPLKLKFQFMCSVEFSVSLSLWSKTR